MKTIKEPARDIPVRAEVDVLVVGGGPAGIMAAEAAAGDGLRVMLVESRGFLGGNLTIGLPILGFLGRKGNQIIEGSAQRFIDRLRARGAASEHRPCKNHMSLTIIDEEEVKRTALEIMEEKGVEVLLYTFFADAIRKGDAVKGVVVESKAGREAILAKTVIDCTGDGDVAFRAGVECRKGDAEGGMQPPTLMFCMKGVDVQRLRDDRRTSRRLRHGRHAARTVPHGQIHHRGAAHADPAGAGGRIPYSGGAHDPHHGTCRRRDLGQHDARERRRLDPSRKLHARRDRGP